MEINWELISNFATAMIAIVNPLEKIPLWVEASKGGKTRFQWRLAALIILTSLVILLTFLLLGGWILDRLKIDLASFKIGGGLILLQFGFSMLKGEAVSINDEDDGKPGSIKSAVVKRYQEVFIPIGVPVIAGPGAITTVMIYGSQSATWMTSTALALVLAGVLALLFLTLITGPAVAKLTGEMPLRLTSRVFGMILIAIAVQFMAEGLRAVFPGWTH
jgi:multiple antibiotic resistance protein